MGWIIRNREDLMGFVDYNVMRLVPGSGVEAIYLPLPDFFDLKTFDEHFDYYSTDRSLLYPLINYRNPNTPFSLTVMEQTARDAIEAVQRSGMGMKRVDHMMLMFECISADQTEIDVERFAQGSGLPMIATQGRDFVVDYVPVGERAVLRFLSAETYYAHIDSDVSVDDRLAALQADTDVGDRLVSFRQAMLARGGFDSGCEMTFPNRSVATVIEHPQFEGVLTAARVGYAVEVHRTETGTEIVA
jgi:hypothetical protein